MTRRLTLLHVLWEDHGQFEDEPDWAYHLRMGEIDAETAREASTIALPEDAEVTFSSWGGVEIRSESLDASIDTAFEEKPEALREPTPEETDSFFDPRCVCPRMGDIVSPTPRCPVQHFQEDPE